MKLFKYEFVSKEELNSILQSIQTEENGQVTTPNLKAKVELGFMMLQNGSYDSQGNEITAPVISEKYCVDMIWKEDTQAQEFEPFEIFPQTPKHQIA